MPCAERKIIDSEKLSQACSLQCSANTTKSFSLIDCVSVGVDRMQRTFEPRRKQAQAWQRSELTDVPAKLIISEAFVEGKLDPKHLARTETLRSKLLAPTQTTVVWARQKKRASG
jgi:hypothetical protein